MEQPYDGYSNLLIRLLKRKGVTVLLDTSLPEEIAGRTNYVKKEIYINLLSEEETLSTLCHELGHWLLYEKFYWLPQWVVRRVLREAYAEQIERKLLKRFENTGLPGVGV